RRHAGAAVVGELPEAVRRRVVDVAAERLGAMAADEVPSSLRPFARFTPSRRRQAVLPIAAALENDEAFREAVAQGLRDNLPELVAALEGGLAVPAADPVDVAAAAEAARRSAEAQRRSTNERVAALEAEVARAAADVERERRRAREGLDRARVAEQTLAERTRERDEAVRALEASVLESTAELHE